MKGRHMFQHEFDLQRDVMISYLQNDVYGIWRDGEQVSYTITEEGKARIEVCLGEKTTSFFVTYVCPDKPERKHCGKYPFVVCMHPISDYMAMVKRGYACLFLDSISIASDDTRHVGAFYDLYPYGTEADTQTGVLMAWGWGASKVLDAVYAGLGEALNLECGNSLVTGVSRWGKATAVLGVFDKRFKMVIPACSGAAGLALYNYKSTGKSYDLSAVGGPKDYTYGDNEPLSCLQSEAERGWFVDAFLKYEKEEDFPFNQDILPKLAAGGARSYFIVAAHMGEDWVNAPSMWQCYLSAKEYYEKEHLGGRIFSSFHKEGHAVLAEDFEKIADTFEALYYQDWWIQKYDLLEHYKKENEKVEKGAVLFAGSSLMEMFPAEKFAKEDKLPFTVINRGIGGYTTENLSSALDICAIDLKPSKVYINIGTNDLSNELITIEEVMSAYESILKRILKSVPGVDITMMAYYPVNLSCAINEGMERTLRIRSNEKISEANRQVQNLAQRLGLKYIDVNAPLTDEAGNLKKEYCLDGMHITEEGYRSIWPLIKATMGL